MVNTPEERLLRTINLGDDSSLVLKTVVFKGEQITKPSHDKLADELASMANANGCVVVLGVDDKTREITGIPTGRLEAVDRYISEICCDSITPSVLFRSFWMELPDSTGTLQVVFKIEIPRSFFVHESPGGYFHRQGNSVRKMRPEQLARLFYQRNQASSFRFEEQPVSQSGINDLNKDLRKRYANISSESAEVVLLKHSLLAKEENGTLVPSVAGILSCCEYPEQFLPSAFIEAVHYRGTRADSNYQIDAQNILGPLDQQINESMAFLRKNQTVGTSKKPQFSERAVFEALVNAIAHRDYSIYGPNIRFFMFDDRLEIYSTGALPYTVTVDNIHLRQATRNELITSLLAETPMATTSTEGIGRDFYVEKRGDGVRVIMDESETLSGKRPVYKLVDDSELLLTIYSANTR
ncbi:MAG: putative DNA binding domain-containing protein [Bacteroidota bacterium]|nr:putative DNA binding domain-containing protein [Bacteroidota bacterium]MDE2646258.1 putative DNA binding domain-containing protein [Bacteroidota bacterium]